MGSYFSSNAQPAAPIPTESSPPQPMGGPYGGKKGKTHRSKKGGKRHGKKKTGRTKTA